MIFALDAGRYAIPLAAAERVVRAAQVTPSPAGPGLVPGVLDVGGRVLPVFGDQARALDYALESEAYRVG